jgi:hypothetical protein
MLVIAFAPRLAPEAKRRLNQAMTTAGLEYCEFADGEVATHAALEEHRNGRSIFLVTDDSSCDIISTCHQAGIDMVALVFVQTNLSGTPKVLCNIDAVRCYIAYEHEVLDSADIFATAMKFRTRDIFGLHKYLRGSAQFEKYVVKAPESLSQAQDAVMRFIEKIGRYSSPGTFSEYAKRIGMMIDELALNAIFHANSKMRNRSRTKSFELEPHEVIQIGWGFDGNVFGFSVSDPFGELGRQTLMDYLNGSRTPGGGDVAQRASAGLGLKFVYDRVEQLIVNVCPGSCTEIIGLLRFRERLSASDRAIRSFHYFTA